MKAIILIQFVTIICFHEIFAQNKVKYAITITAQIDGLKEGDKYYLNKTDAAGIDSCTVTGGELKFKLTRPNAEPERLSISSTPDIGGSYKDFSVSFWADESDILVKGAANDPENITIAGSAVHNRFLTFYNSLQPYEKMLKNVDGIQADSVKMLLREEYLDFISTNKSSYNGIIILYFQTLGKKLSPDESLSLLNTFSKEMQLSSYGKAIVQIVKNSDRIKLGDIAPDFTQPNLDGKPVSLKSFRGKYVLIEFWSSWCGPCKTENPYLREAYNEFRSKGFEILGISLDVNINTWKKTIEKEKLTWSQVSDLKGWSNEAAKIYNINGIPTNYLLDPNGKIIATDLRGNALKAKLNELLK